MNYLKQINGFWIWRKMNTISHAQMDLYFAFLDCANTALWRKDFSVPNSTLMNLCQLSKTQLFNARNQLVQLGLIEYTPGKRSCAGKYNIVPLYGTESGTNSKTNPTTNPETNSGNIYKEKENVNNKPLKKSYRKNVFLTEDEYFELVSDYGGETTCRILDKLDSYKAESGKNYKDDFAAIKRWVADSIANEDRNNFTYSVFSDDYDHKNLEALTRKNM